MSFDIALSLENIGTVKVSTNFLFSLLYLGVLNSGFATALWLKLLQKREAGVISSYLFLVPVWSVASSWLLLGEAITLNDITGMILVMLGVWIVTRTHIPIPKIRRGKS